MKTVIIKAIAKANNTNAKTAHIPFYKGITAPTTTPTAPTTTKDLYVYTLRYTFETYPAVKNFPISWENACKKLYEEMQSFERFLYACNRDYWKYMLLYYFYTELAKNPYIRENWNRYYLVSNLWDNAIKNREKNRPFYGKFGF